MAVNQNSVISFSLATSHTHVLHGCNEELLTGHEILYMHLDLLVFIELLHHFLCSNSKDGVRKYHISWEVEVVLFNR